MVVCHDKVFISLVRKKNDLLIGSRWSEWFRFSLSLCSYGTFMRDFKLFLKFMTYLEKDDLEIVVDILWLLIHRKMEHHHRLNRREEFLTTTPFVVHQNIVDRSPILVQHNMMCLRNQYKFHRVEQLPNRNQLNIIVPYEYRWEDFRLWYLDAVLHMHEHLWEFVKLV